MPESRHNLTIEFAGQTELVLPKQAKGAKSLKLIVNGVEAFERYDYIIDGKYIVWQSAIQLEPGFIIYLIVRT